MHFPPQVPIFEKSRGKRIESENDGESNMAMIWKTHGTDGAFLRMLSCKEMSTHPKAVRFTVIT
jgi:hypothetical protein